MTPEGSQVCAPRLDMPRCKHKPASLTVGTYLQRAPELLVILKRGYVATVLLVKLYAGLFGSGIRPGMLLACDI